MTINVGDIVKRYDQPGSGTGILYRVIAIGEECERYVRYRNGTSKRMKAKKASLKPIIVMFDSKWSKERNHIQHFVHDLEKVDIVAIASEWSKLHLFLQDEARRLGVHSSEPTSSPQNNSHPQAEAT